jgi:phosphohistidine phosphatase SixA
MTIIFALMATLFGCTAGVTPAGKSDFTTFFIVRHTEKASDGTKDPPLTVEGKARAIELAEILKDANVDALFASEYQRTQLTLKPISDMMNIPITVVSARDTEALIEKAIQKGKVVAIAGHSNTVPDIVKALTGQEFTITEDEHDALFVVTRYRKGTATVVRLRYGEPSHH